MSLARADRSLPLKPARDVNFDLGPVHGVRDHPGSDLSWWAAENSGIGCDRVVAANAFEMRSCYLRQESRESSGPDRRSAA